MNIVLLSSEIIIFLNELDLLRFSLGKNDSCLKFRHIYIKLLIIIVVLFSASCGKVVNSVPESTKIENSISFLMAESSCQNRPDERSAIYNDVVSLINDIHQTRTTYLGNLFEVRNYDFLTPLVVNPGILKRMMIQVKNNDKLNLLTVSELDRLLEYANRYEGMRCQFNFLSERKRNDLRPYLNYLHNNDRTDSNLIKMCTPFDKIGSCAKGLEISKRNKKLDAFIANYKNRFEAEIFEPLFLLKKNHSRFSCQRQNDKTEITVEVQNMGWNSELFKVLLDTIETTWSKENFKFRLIEVIVPTTKTVKIVPIGNGISHVNDNDNLTIYLAKNLDLMTMSKVVAHEFGHVLGFPDCYIEFYDTNENELVYYELSSKNQNIMCSLKYGVVVQDSYIDQLKENSCLF